MVRRFAAKVANDVTNRHAQQIEKMSHLANNHSPLLDKLSSNADVVLKIRCRIHNNCSIHSDVRRARITEESCGDYYDLCENGRYY